MSLATNREGIYMAVLDASPVNDFLTGYGFSESDLVAVDQWWMRQKNASETVAATMTRLGVLRPAAERTIELMRKGFVQGVSRHALFSTDGIARLRDAIRAPRFPSSIVAETAGRECPPLPPSTTPIRSFTATPAPVVPAAFPTVGETLGRCLLTGVLGKGGFGTVFSALHTTLNMPVAVKVLSPKDRLPVEVRELLRREAQALARISHPGIVRVLDFEDSDPPYFVMEFVEGPSLADLIRQTGSVRQERAIDMVLDVVEVLAEAWKSGIVHRDIKPGNILVTKTGQAKLADLGLAQVPGLDDAGLTPDPNKPIGTCAYIAPEQIRNKGAVDFRADMYGLGGTLYHAITGQLPFPGKSQREVIMKHLTAEPVPPSSIAPDRITTQLSQVILKLLHKEPTDRYESYAELAEALRSAKLRTEHLTRQDIQMTMPDAETPRRQSSRSRLAGWLGLKPK
jgi:predicted Ser/Thr protein kinase